MGKHQITYGTTIIPFDISYSERKTLGIAVHPNSKVEVTAPINLSMDMILTRMERRASWILKQIRKYSRNEFTRREIEWVGGETIYYLGRQYRLKILKGESNIKMSGKFLWVTVPEKQDKTAVKKLVDAWYKKHANIKLNERIERYKNLLQKEKVEMNRLIVRKLEKRWGSCSNKGNIILNTDLVKVPVDCIDYVIVHEICHLKHLNHSKKFYQTLERSYPHWQTAKNRLNSFVSNI